MLRTLTALAKVDGRVSVVPRADRAVHDQGPVRARRRRLADDVSDARPGDDARRGRVYGEGDDDLRDLHLRQRRADEPARRARRSRRKHGWKTRVVDLRWLVPLNEAFIARAGRRVRKRILSSTKAATAPASARASSPRSSKAGYGAQAVAARGRRGYVHAAGGCGVPGDSVGRGDRRRGCRPGVDFLTLSPCGEGQRAQHAGRGFGVFELQAVFGKDDPSPCFATRSGPSRARGEGSRAGPVFREGPPSLRPAGSAPGNRSTPDLSRHRIPPPARRCRGRPR